MASSKRISRLREWLIGNKSEFSLAVRIFHVLLLITLSVLAYTVPFNFLLGLPQLSLISFLMLLIFSYLYFISRFKGQTSRAILIGSCFGNVLYVLVFFFNSGIQGPVVLTSALTLILIICCAPEKQYKIWVPLNLVLMFGLFSFEYFFPQWIPFTYTSRADQFMDIGFSYLFLLVPVYYSITYIRRSYDAKRISDERSALAIKRQHQQIVDQNIALERLNSEKNKLVSIIAHDLRSPLANIQSYLELLSELGLEEKEKQKIEKDLLKHTKNASEMLTKLLSWSKSQMSGIIVQLDNIPLQDALLKTLETEQSIALKKGLNFVFELDPTIEVVADGNMLELVVRNLISNAIKFTSYGGSISVTTEITESECWLKIEDNGIGISEERQKDIFTFSAGSTYGTQKEKGNGLGLLLCKDFIEVQGGRIWFQSTAGVGTVFHISLPLVTVYEPVLN